MLSGDRDSCVTSVVICNIARTLGQCSVLSCIVIVKLIDVHATDYTEIACQDKISELYAENYASNTYISNLERSIGDIKLWPQNQKSLLERQKFTFLQIVSLYWKFKKI